MNYTTEEKIELYTELVTSYLKSSEPDLINYIRMNDYPLKSELSRAIVACKKYVSDELYKQLIEKVFPFGIKGEDCTEEQKKLREKVKFVSEQIAYQNANLIDVLELITTDLDKYLYYLKLSRHYYNDIGAGVFQKV